MAVEIEVKMSLPDRAAFEKQLEEAGAERVKEVLEVNTFFDRPDSALKAADEGLRVRLERSLITGDIQAIVTHKGPRDRGIIKTRRETELKVEDARRAAELLTALGFVSVVSFEKHRRRWLLDRCIVEVDTIPYLGDFVEIEGPSEKAVLTLRNRLGCDRFPVITASYISLLTTYLEENAIRANHIGFELAQGVS